MQRQLETPEPIHLYVEIGKGQVTIHAASTTETRVEIDGEHAAEVSVTFDDNQLRVIAPREGVSWPGRDRALAVRVDLPTGSDIGVKTGSADIVIEGRVNVAHLRTGSGHVTCDTVAGPGLVETGSGDVEVSECGGELRVKSGSGDVSVGRCLGEFHVSTGSGNVEIGAAGGRTVAKTGSGDLRVATADTDISLTAGSGNLTIDRVQLGRVSVTGASSDVQLGIPAGTPVWADINTVTGSLRSDLESVGAPQDGQQYLELRIRTVSGNILLHQF